MDDELRPTPIVRGKAADRFYRTIEENEISSEQRKFLDRCKHLLDDADL